MVERGIARDGYPVLDLEGKEIGVITSGSPAPFLKTNIAMALVPTAVATSGEDVLVQVRPNQTARAKQVPAPVLQAAEGDSVRESLLRRRGRKPSLSG